MNKAIEATAMERQAVELGDHLEKNAAERKGLLKRLYAIEESTSKVREITSMLLANYDEPETKGRNL